MKHIILAFCMLFSTTVLAEEVTHPDFDVSANVTVASDYIWRGTTQTGGKPSIQGGFDVAHSSGLYLGNWNANVIDGIEMDLYGGVSNQMFDSGVTYDIGVVRYFYSELTDWESTDVYAGLSGETGLVDPAFKWYHNLDSSGDYFDFSASVPVSIITLSGHYGLGVDDVTTHDWSVGASVELVNIDWSLSYSNADLDTGRLVAAAHKRF